MLVGPATVIVEAKGMRLYMRKADNQPIKITSLNIGFHQIRLTPEQLVETIRALKTRLEEVLPSEHEIEYLIQNPERKDDYLCFGEAGYIWGLREDASRSGNYKWIKDTRDQFAIGAKIKKAKVRR